MAKGLPLSHALLLLLSCLLEAVPAAGNDLDNLIKDDLLKFVFVGGKGGVGKTTSSSAIASQLSLSLTKDGATRRILLISTDPAHSLSDAFRMHFSNTPTPILPDLPNLEVMEINPADTMKAELASWANLARELGYDPDSKDGEEGGIGEKIHSFQQWLSGVPGIDEATALSSAIEHIESGRYDMIVFDTAPTGHTLKLLELPTILQVGLDKLEGWQATLWGYWEMIKGFTSGSSSDAGSVKQKVSERLRQYKASIGRVADMITDKAKTRFVVVCIAEYLSISESRRLLSELDRFDVAASHVLVNQLVSDYMEEDELNDLRLLIHTSTDPKQKAILSKALASAELTTARHKIQTKYLHDLKACPEVNRRPDPEEPELKTNRKAGTEPLTVLQLPLLPSEVTGPKAILDFSHLLVGKTLNAAAMKSVGRVGPTRKLTATKPEPSTLPTGAKPSGAKPSGAKPGSQTKQGLASMAKGALDLVMADPELAKMVKESPKLLEVLEEVKDNPLATMKYMTDPEVGPFLQKAKKKLMPAMSGGKQKRRKAKSAAVGEL